MTPLSLFTQKSMNKLNSGINNGVASDQFMECTWMKKGKSEDGVIGNIQKPETSTTWVYSRNSPQTLINDLRAMTEDTFKISKVGYEYAIMSTSTSSRGNLMVSTSMSTSTANNLMMSTSTNTVN